MLYSVIVMDDAELSIKMTVFVADAFGGPVDPDVKRIAARSKGLAWAAPVVRLYNFYNVSGKGLQ